MVYYCIHMSSPILSKLIQMNPDQVLHAISLKYFLILSSHLRVGFLSDLFYLTFSTKTLFVFISPPPSNQQLRKT